MKNEKDHTFFFSKATRFCLIPGDLMGGSQMFGHFQEIEDVWPFPVFEFQIFRGGVM